MVFGSSKSGALQQHFGRFLKNRKDMIKCRNVEVKNSNMNRKDPNFKTKLRGKFVEQCKKYFGVPYAKKYWSDGEEHFDAPLFLDCCALIRQAV